jgi:hypothetical protein
VHIQNWSTNLSKIQCQCVDAEGLQVPMDIVIKLMDGLEAKEFMK